jgi:hypothetical protein
MTFFINLLHFPQLVAGWKGEVSRARVELPHLLLFFTPIHGGLGGSASSARIDRAHSDRARSTSKEAGRPSYKPASHDHFSTLTSFTVRRSPRLRASNEGLLRPRVPRARRALLIASHSPHTPSQTNTAALHRRKEDQAQVACRHRPLNR